MAAIAKGLFFCAVSAACVGKEVRRPEFVICRTVLRDPSSLILQRPLQVNYLSSYFFHARVESQRAAECFEGCNCVALQLISLPDDRSSEEVVSVDLQRLMTVLNGRFMLFHLEKGLATEIPRLCNPRRVFYQGRRNLGSTVIFLFFQVLANLQRGDVAGSEYQRASTAVESRFLPTPLHLGRYR